MNEYVELNPAFFGRQSNVRCHVWPRYSAGSPAMVPDSIALAVARDERSDYAHALSGSYGEAQKRRAELLGLRGIAVAMGEKGSGRSFRWLVYDLVTGEYYRRHDDAGIIRLGFTPYRELSDRARAAVNQTGQDRDYERTYWKYENLQWVRYEPELVRLP